jgi:hypothetical protein
MAQAMRSFTLPKGIFRLELPKDLARKAFSNPGEPHKGRISDELNCAFRYPHFPLLWQKSTQDGDQKGKNGLKTEGSAIRGERVGTKATTGRKYPRP